MERSARLVAPDVTAVQGGAAYLTAMAQRLAPSLTRAEPRQWALASRRGLLRPAARQPRWPGADGSGDARPDGWQHLWRRASGGPGGGA
jgi:hypothetical protein